MTSELTGGLVFEVDARHIRQLGRELVGNKITAVSELIKNAYDADATYVTVLFSPEASESLGCDLIISDNGTGMILDDVRQGWMIISTDTKYKKKVSNLYSRKRTGSKGIGRFSAESLGNKLIMSSTVSGSTEKLIMEFDWEQYIPGVRLEEISNTYRYETCEADEHGTTLHIMGLYQAWKRPDLERIKNAIFLLQPPFAISEVLVDKDNILDPGFKVAVQYGNEAISTAMAGNIEDVYTAATAWLSGCIKDDGAAIIKVASQHLGINETHVLDQRFLTIGRCEFKAAYFIFKRDALNPGSSVGVQRARVLAKDFGGIRLYRDHMRVMPYGDPRDDWLGLDAIYRGRQIIAPIGRKNFFGEVLLKLDENMLIIDTASREGVIENDAFHELRRFLRDSIQWAVNLVASVRDKKGRPNDPKPNRPESRSKILAPLKGGLQNVIAASSPEAQKLALVELSEAVDQAQEIAEDSDEQEETVREQMVDEITLLRILASLGGSVAIFSHEVRAVLNQAEAALGDMVESVAENETREALEAAERNMSSLGDLASYLELYVSKTSRRRRESISIADLIGTFIKRIQPLLDRRRIRIDHRIFPVYLRTHPMARSELEAILFNLLSNSVRALDKETIEERMILVKGSLVDDQVCIAFLDNGIGIPEQNRPRVFDAFYTTSTADDAELGLGTGLGLSIVADIARSNGGSARVATAVEPFLTCIEVRIPAMIDFRR